MEDSKTNKQAPGHFRVADVQKVNMALCEARSDRLERDWQAGFCGKESLFPEAAQSEMTRWDHFVWSCSYFHTRGKVLIRIYFTAKYDKLWL